MVESEHAIAPIVTIEAVCTEIRGVICHEGRILSPVAICACLQRNRVIHRIYMASGALHGLERIIDLMPDQAEFRNGMIEFVQRICQRGEIASLVIRMALVTADNLTDVAVQPLVVEDLRGNSIMAGQTQLCLDGAQRLMTTLALLFKISMRVKTFQGVPRLPPGTQRAGAECQASLPP